MTTLATRSRVHNVVDTLDASRYHAARVAP
jgi:hypothetical protein